MAMLVMSYIQYSILISHGPGLADAHAFTHFETETGSPANKIKVIINITCRFIMSSPVFDHQASTKLTIVNGITGIDSSVMIIMRQ